MLGVNKTLMKILTSATRIVLIMVAVTMCIGLFTGVVEQDTFKTALLMILSFYFGQKTNETNQA